MGGYLDIIAMALHLRPFQPTDLPSVRALNRIPLEALGVWRGEGPWSDDLLNIKEAYCGGVFFVGEWESQVVAMGAIRKIDNSTCEVKRMRVLPDFQGLGFGKLILRELLEAAKKMGFQNVILETSEKQIAAITLYTGFGFIPFKSEVINGHGCTWYQKVLV